jgi:hypothetical protein
MRIHAQVGRQWGSKAWRPCQLLEIALRLGAEAVAGRKRKPFGTNQIPLAFEYSCFSYRG